MPINLINLKFKNSLMDFGIIIEKSLYSEVGQKLRLTSGLREVFCVAKNLGERSATSEPFKPCYTRRGRSPRVQRPFSVWVWALCIINFRVVNNRKIYKDDINI